MAGSRSPTGLSNTIDASPPPRSISDHTTPTPHKPPATTEKARSPFSRRAPAPHLATPQRGGVIGVPPLGGGSPTRSEAHRVIEKPNINTRRRSGDVHGHSRPPRQHPPHAEVPWITNYWRLFSIPLTGTAFERPRISAVKSQRIRTIYDAVVDAVAISDGLDDRKSTHLF